MDYWNMNTDTRTTSIVLDTLATLDPQNSLAPNTVRWLMGARKADRWETTQENAWAIMALTDWMAATGELEGDYDWQVALNDAALGTGTVTPATVAEVTTLHAGIEELPAGSDQRRGHRPDRLGRSNREGTALLHDAPQDLPAGRRRRAAQPRGDDQPRISPGRLRADRPRRSRTCPDRHPGEGGRRDRRQPDGRGAELALLRRRGRPAPRGRRGAGHQPEDDQQDGRRAEGRGRERRLRSWADWGWQPTHVELRDEKAVLFETALDPGTYEFSYQIRASLPGEYLTLPPTVSQMYFPEVWGRGAGSVFTVTG